MLAAKSPLSLTRVGCAVLGPRCFAGATAEPAYSTCSTSPHFHFNLSLMNAKNSGRKLITPRKGRVAAWEREGKTERERKRERGRKKENGELSSFSNLLFLQKCPLFYFPLSLSPGSSNEWHYRQSHIRSDTNLFRLQRHSVFPQNQGRFVWGQFGFHKGFKWFLWR